ncbi:MAG: Ig-like domain-containing protein [Candidatus Thorarchaeota archaeon]
MLKEKYLITFVILILTLQPFMMIEPQKNFGESLSSQKLAFTSPQPSTTIKPMGVGGEENIKTNVAENSGFESVNSYDIPSGYSWDISTYIERNASYQDIVHGGSYSYLISGKGTAQKDSLASSTRYLNSGPTVYLDQKIYLDFWAYVVSNADIGSGGYIRFRVMILSGGGTYQMNYILSDDTLTVNTTTWKYFDTRISTGSWFNIQRNLTRDFDLAYGSVPITEFTYIPSIYIDAYSPLNPSGFSTVVVDDVNLENDTAYEYISQNSDFEDGNGGYWDNNKQGPGLISQIAEHTEGSYASNLTAYSYYQGSLGYVELTNILGMGGSPTVGYYATSPGNLVFECDWKYTDTNGGGANQQAYLYLDARNGTHTVFLYLYFGTYNDVVPNNNVTSSNSITRSFCSQGFSTRDTWNHLIFDPYYAMAELGFNNMAFNAMQFYIESGDQKDCTATLLIDDFVMRTYPMGDPGFEEDWYYQSGNPIVSWNGDNNHLYANLTSDAHSGNHAANLTSYNGNSQFLQRDTRLHVTDDLYTDFWWKLDRIKAGFSCQSYIYLGLEGGKGIYYIIGASDLYIPINNSNYVYFFVNQFNSTGTWNNLVRNLNTDIYVAFGYGNWNITSMTLMNYSVGTSMISTLFDDMQFVYDTMGPEIVTVELKNTPTYYANTVYDITINDALSPVDEVVLYYRNASTWYDISVPYIGNNVYRASIPFGEYGTTYEFYVVAEDTMGQLTTDDNSGQYYHYLIGDDVNPIITITAPTNDSTASNDLLIEVDCSDEASGIGYVEFFDGPTFLLGSAYTAPYNYLWDTRTASNGLHIITATVFDNAGNSRSASINVTLANDLSAPVITNLQLNPVEPIRNEPVEVSVQVTDASDISFVNLVYRIDGGSWIEVSMTLIDGNFTGEIPGIGLRSKVDYYIQASDIYDQIGELGSEITPYSYEFPYTAKIFFTRFGALIAVGVIGICIGSFFLARHLKRRKEA